jgi:DNA processing protein
VEGTERSGARITAGFAADLGREVLCVPGEAGRRLSAAPHLFLRDGAKLCESAADVVRGIAADAPAGPVDAEAGAPDQAAVRLEQAVILDHGEGAVRDVLRALESGSMTVDELSRRCALTAAKAAAAVTELEIDGLARRVDGGRYRLQRR